MIERLNKVYDGRQVKNIKLAKAVKAVEGMEDILCQQNCQHP